MASRKQKTVNACAMRFTPEEMKVVFGLTGTRELTDVLKTESGDFVFIVTANGVEVEKAGMPIGRPVFVPNPSTGQHEFVGLEYDTMWTWDGVS